MRCKSEREAEAFIKRIVDYQLISGVLWTILAIVQLCTCWLGIAAVCNFIIAFSRFMSISKIKARDSEIPDIFESIFLLVGLAVANLLLGGVIGVVSVAFDFYIRSLILENRHIFNRRSVNEGDAETASSSAKESPLTSEDETMELMTRLARLRELGALTLDEYNRMKQSLLEQFRKSQ